MKKYETAHHLTIEKAFPRKKRLVQFVVSEKFYFEWLVQFVVFEKI